MPGRDGTGPLGSGPAGRGRRSTQGRMGGNAAASGRILHMPKLRRKNTAQCGNTVQLVSLSEMPFGYGKRIAYKARLYYGIIEDNGLFELAYAKSYHTRFKLHKMVSDEMCTHKR